MKEGAVITDGEYNLQFYSMPKEKEAAPGFYIKEGIFILIFNLKKKIAPGSKLMTKLLRKDEQLKIRTLLSSTKLTTSAALLALLNWQKVPNQLSDTLSKINLIPTIDVLKVKKKKTTDQQHHVTSLCAKF